MNTIPNYRLYREISGEAGNFWLHCETLSQRSKLHNWEISLHRHESLFQIFVLQKGQGELLSKTGNTPFQAPCVIYIAPRSPHGFRYTNDAEGIVLTVLEDRLPAAGAGDPGIAAFFTQLRVTPMPSGEREAERIIGLVEEVYQEFQTLAPASNVLLDAMITELVVRLARIGTAATPHDPTVSGRERDRARMHALMSLIAAHFREHQPVGFYGERLSLSVPHLNRITRREAGVSVQDLLTLHVLRAAKRDLLFTPTPVAAIAYALGFQDPAYFNRFFKRQTGMTPGQFRKAEHPYLAGETGEHVPPETL